MILLWYVKSKLPLTLLSVDVQFVKVNTSVEQLVESVYELGLYFLSE